MKASELRIGDWVLGDVEWDGQDKPFQVNLIENVDYGDFINPIPLTEEWLTRFGFESSGRVLPSYHRIFWENRQESIHLELEQGSWDAIVYDQWSEHIALPAPIEYVHQLQNLYFALTGEELTIKQ